MPFLLGAGTAFFFLVETNMSLLIGALSVIALLLARGQKLARLSAYAFSTVIAFLLFWVIDGRSGREHLELRLRVGAGFFRVHRGNVCRERPSWRCPAAFTLVVLVAFIVRFASEIHDFHLTWAPLILVAGFLFSAFKETFVVHGPAHKVIVFAACLVALLAVPVSASMRAPFFGALVLASVALVAVSGFGTTLSALRSGMGTNIRVPAAVLSPARRYAEMQTVREEIHEGFFPPGLALDPTSLALARGRSTYIQDGEAGISWAYPSLIWKPLPVLQEYSAYTPYLDQLNAGFIASDKGPERIWCPPSSAIGSQVPAFESPAAVVSLICHYAQLGASSSWQVLGRVTNRCGSMRQISVVHSRIGRTIRVPQPTRPDEAMVTR